MNNNSYRGRNPNLTDADVADWLLRVSGQHPDQLEQDRQDQEEEDLRDQLFPYHVECSFDRVLAVFPESKERGHMYDWIHNFEAWVVANCGAKNQFWQMEEAQGQPISGEWTNISMDYYFKSKDNADVLEAQFGGHNPY